MGTQVTSTFLYFESTTNFVFDGSTFISKLQGATPFKQIETPIAMPKAFAFGDLDGDGLVDIVALKVNA